MIKILAAIKLGSVIRAYLRKFKILKIFSFRRPVAFTNKFIQHITGFVPAQTVAIFIYGEETLREGLAAFKEAGLEPFLIFGSLLGYCREGRPIEHDDDIDLALIDPPREQLLKVIETLNKGKYRVGFQKPLQKPRRHAGKSTLMRWTNVKHLFYIDIYCLYSEGGHMALYNNWGPGNTTYRNSFPAEFFGKLRTVTFLNNEIFIPAKPEELLSLIYGNWRIPDKNSRANLCTEEVRGNEG